MSDIESEKSERKVTITADDTRRIMREAIQDAAFPVGAGEPLKVWLHRVARSVGLTFNRLYDIYCGETIPRWHEGEAIRRKAEEKKKILAKWGEITARQELAELRTRLERLEGNATDQNERRTMVKGAIDSDGQTPLDLG